MHAKPCEVTDENAYINKKKGEVTQFQGRR